MTSICPLSPPCWSYISPLVSKWRYTVARGVIASVILLQGCGVDPSSTVATVTPTGYDTGEQLFGPKVEWIDNDHVIFNGLKSNPDPSKRSYGAWKMYIWSESTKSVREHVAAPQSFCYADGRILYHYSKKDEAGNWIVHEGLLGKEEIVKMPISPSSPTSSNLNYGFNYFSCKLYSLDDFVPAMPKVFKTVALREGDGYLAFEPTRSSDVVRVPQIVVLYREKGVEPVTLPIIWYGIIGLLTPREITYSPYFRAYVLYQSHFDSGKWPLTEPRVVHVLTASDGKVKRVTIPPTAVFQWPKPTQAGWIYAGALVQDGKWAGHNGLYLFNGEWSKKIEAGQIHAIAVSPNGCKAAVAVNNYSHIPILGTPTTLKIFNFCKVAKPTT